MRLWQGLHNNIWNKQQNLEGMLQVIEVYIKETANSAVNEKKTD